MTSSHFLPLREVRPSGWIEDFLRNQASGLTGHPEVSGYPYGQQFWGSDNSTAGSYAAWWPYEQTGYWIDAALKCGFLIGDQSLYQRALDEIETALDQAGADGFIGPAILREKDRWPHAVFFRAVLAQYEITGDERYIEALARHYRALPHPMNWDRDVTGVEILVYLFSETGDAYFLDMAEELYARYNAKFSEHDCSLQTLASEKKSTEHGVTFNEIAKLPVILYMVTGKSEYLEAAVNGYAKLDRDQLLADGLHSCSEHLRGRDPLDSHESCDITDHTWALGYLLLATGNVKYADRIEKIIFNALPGSVTKDFRALQYFSCPNQLIATHTSNHNRFQRGFNWMSYRPDHEVQCCPGNIQRAMPNYVARQWFKRGDQEIVAALFGSGHIQTHLAGVQVSINTETYYPAAQAIDFIINPAKSAHFIFTFRIPAWCNNASMLLNNQPISLPLSAGTFQSIKREWQPGDRLHLELPFELHLQHFPKSGISVDFGPLTMSLPVEYNAEPEEGDSTDIQRRDIHAEFYTPHPKGATVDFPAWEFTPLSQWNYALCVDESSLPKTAQIDWYGLAGHIFDPAQPFVTVRLPARRVANWKLIDAESIHQMTAHIVHGKWKFVTRKLKGHFVLTPQLPSRNLIKSNLEKNIEWIELIPYGSTLLRLTVFPQAIGI